MPIIHPPGYDKKKQSEKHIKRMWTEREREKTWEEKQQAEDIAELPGGIWSQEAQFDGNVDTGKSLGVKELARDPITATPYHSRREVENVEDGEGEGVIAREVGEEGKEVGEDEAVDNFGSIHGVSGKYKGVGSTEKPSGTLMKEGTEAGVEEEVYRGLVNPEASYFEVPSTTNNLKFNGLFSRNDRLVVKKATKVKSGGKNKKAENGSRTKKSLNKKVRGFGSKNMLNDKGLLGERRADDRHYRSWVVPYTDKLLDKSQAR